MPKINKERDHPLDIALGQAVRLRRRELGLWGDVSGLTGNVSGLSGDASGLTGDLDEIPASARPCNVEDWVEAAA
jgi:hypothetical protein